MNSFEERFFQNYLLIKVIYFQKDLDTMLIILSNGKVLKYRYPPSSVFYNATKEELHHYTLIGKGAGIYWPDLKEDFSLDHFLQEKFSEHLAA